LLQIDVLNEKSDFVEFLKKGLQNVFCKYTFCEKMKIKDANLLHFLIKMKFYVFCVVIK